MCLARGRIRSSHVRLKSISDAIAVRSDANSFEVSCTALAQFANANAWCFASLRHPPARFSNSRQHSM